MNTISPIVCVCVWWIFVFNLFCDTENEKHIYNYSTSFKFVSEPKFNCNCEIVTVLKQSVLKVVLFTLVKVFAYSVHLQKEDKKCLFKGISTTLQYGIYGTNFHFFGWIFYTLPRNLRRMFFFRLYYHWKYHCNKVTKSTNLFIQNWDVNEFLWGVGLIKPRQLYF